MLIANEINTVNTFNKCVITDNLFNIDADVWRD